MKNVNVAAVVALLLGLGAIGYMIVEPAGWETKAVVNALLALVAAVLSFRE